MFKILVVEDDRELNKTVCTFLRKNDFDAVGCLNANDAYNAMYGDLFDLIISDIMMPGTDGFEFAETVRSLDQEIPILFMTARDDFRSKQRGYRLGILTNGPSYGQRAKVRKSGLEDLLDAVVVSGETDCAKPDPRIFEMIAEMLSLPTAQCAYVGDMFRNDIYGAHLAGMVPVWFWPHGPREVSVEVRRIQSLTDLLDLFPGPAEKESV